MILGAARIDQRWDFAITKAALSYFEPLPYHSIELHIYYAFAYLPERNGNDNDVNHEVGVFIKVPLLLR